MNILLKPRFDYVYYNVRYDVALNKDVYRHIIHIHAATLYVKVVICYLKFM